LQSLRVLEDPKTLGLVVNYGERAGEVMIKHPGMASEVIAKFGNPGVGAMNAVSGPQARQLTSLVQTGAAGDMGKLLPVIEQYGDKAMDFIWRHKGALALTAGAVAFISHPEPYINGVKSLVVEPAAQVVGEVGKEIVVAVNRDVNWGWLIYPIAVLLFLAFGGIALLRRIGGQLVAPAGTAASKSGGKDETKA
jgi:hypothetical protein